MSEIVYTLPTESGESSSSEIYWIIAILIVLLIIIGVLIFFVILPLNRAFNTLNKVLTNVEGGINLIDCLAGNAQLAALDLCRTEPPSICGIPIFGTKFCELLCPIPVCIVPEPS